MIKGQAERDLNTAYENIEQLLNEREEIGLKLIADLQSDIGKNIYEDSNIPEREATAAQLGRIGALQLAILKIKIAFNLPLV